jgi:hypothetical protein
MRRRERTDQRRPVSCAKQPRVCGSLTSVSPVSCGSGPRGDRMAFPEATFPSRRVHRATDPQPSDNGRVGSSALLTPDGFPGTTALGWNSGMAGSQPSCAAWSSAFTSAEESNRLGLPNQPQVQHAWFLRRSRITTTEGRPPVEWPIFARSPRMRVATH